MKREDIYQLLAEAKSALATTHPDAKSIKDKVDEKTNTQYEKCVRRIFGVTPLSGNLKLPSDAKSIITKVRESKKKSTLRMYARSVRHISMQILQSKLKDADIAQRQGNWVEVERIVSLPSFKALTKLSPMLPAEYSENWEAESGRKGKKSSLLRLPKDWREQMCVRSKGQFRVPMILCMLTGARPVEFEYGIQLRLTGDSLIVGILGAKVTENAGQKFRVFKLAKHSLTLELIKYLKFDDKDKALVKVKNGNSITTHMREVGNKIWPRRKESITCYTARHAMAAECKQAVYEGANTDLVSQVLGHVVDKTATYYGNRFQTGGVSVVPSDVNVPRQVRRKTQQRSKERRSEGKMPSQKAMAMAPTKL